MLAVLEKTKVSNRQFPQRFYPSEATKPHTIFDDLYRLTSETITNDPHAGGITYTFDGVGNRQTRASSVSPIPTQTFSGAYDQNDRLTASGYTYDNDGNTLTDPAGNSYTYDTLDRMTSATVNGTNISYVYDGDGNRVSKAVNSVTTNYLVDTNNLTGFAQVVDELQLGLVKKVYTYGSSLISIDDLTAIPTMHYYGKDGQGSVRFLMDSTGTISDTYDYDAFGNLINSTGSTPNVYLYDGEQFDPDLGQYYLRARYMNQTIGRFQTMDSFEGDEEDPLSFHKYVFVKNRPLDQIDPSGNDGITGPTGSRISELLKGIVFTTSKAGVELFRDPNKITRKFVLAHPWLGSFIETVHTFLVFVDYRGFTEKVLEGGPEKNASSPAWDYGHLIKAQSPKVSSHRRVAPMEWTKLDNPYGSTPDSDKQFKDAILQAYNDYNNTANYFPIPQVKFGTVNSNSFTGSVLRRVGIDLPEPPEALGWDFNIY